MTDPMTSQPSRRASQPGSRRASLGAWPALLGYGSRPKLHATACSQMSTLLDSLDAWQREAALEYRSVELPFAAGSTAGGRLCMTIENLCTPAECARLIALTTNLGYEPATINAGGGELVRRDDVRKSGRCIVDSRPFAAQLWERVQFLLPEEHRAHLARWEPVGLNERIRVLRYDPGDYFKPHQDGSFLRTGDGVGEGERSFYTLMLYLDTPEAGGDTRFLNPHNPQAASVVHPRTGLGLLFDHELLHEGCTLVSGVKHALRTDCMFRRIGPWDPSAGGPADNRG